MDTWPLSASLFADRLLLLLFWEDCSSSRCLIALFVFSMVVAVVCEIVLSMVSDSCPRRVRFGSTHMCLKTFTLFMR